MSPLDHWIPLAAGRVFAREWPAPAAASDRAPLVLMHDSLGCVELWRDLPGLLRDATGRRVIAYDRLGFGRSDARSAPPSLQFVAEEAATGFAAVREQLGVGRFAVLGHSGAHPRMIGRLAAGPSRVEILAGGGHMPHRERPDEVLRRVAGFLA